MYTPSFNRIADRTLLIEAMRSHSFALLSGGEPLSATHLPLAVKDEGEHGVLEGHFALANPHWQALAGRETLVVFTGPHSYVSPTLYEEPTSVPTWNYIAVHACGKLSLVEDADAKDTLLGGLFSAFEPAFAERWAQMPEDYRRAMLAGIVGFRIPIERIEGKFKLGQNRPETDRQTMRAAFAAGDSDQQALAAWMQKLAV